MNGTSTFGKTWVAKIIIINIIVFLIQILVIQMRIGESTAVLYNGQPLPIQLDFMTFFFADIPALILKKGYVWQVFTYMFLHSPTFIPHILINMFMLFMFGTPIEMTWGGKRFLIYYLFTGIGAGLTILLFNSLFGPSTFKTPTVGASGAVFGLFLAFGKLFPETELRFFPLFFIPIKAKYAVFIFGGLELFLQIFSGGATGISHVGHLGGLFFGIVYFIFMRRHNVKFQTKLFKAKIEKEIINDDSKKILEALDTQTFLLNILNKIKTAGINSISDDEFQRYRYIDIMHENDDPDDPDIESQLLREIKKYIH